MKRKRRPLVFMETNYDGIANILFFLGLAIFTLVGLSYNPKLKMYHDYMLGFSMLAGFAIVFLSIPLRGHDVNVCYSVYKAIQKQKNLSKMEDDALRAAELEISQL